MMQPISRRVAQHNGIQRSVFRRNFVSCIRMYKFRLETIEEVQEDLVPILPEDLQSKCSALLGLAVFYAENLLPFIHDKADDAEDSDMIIDR